MTDPHIAAIVYASVAFLAVAVIAYVRSKLAKTSGGKMTAEEQEVYDKAKEPESD